MEISHSKVFFFIRKGEKKSQKKDPSGEMSKWLRREHKKAAAPQNERSARRNCVVSRLLREASQVDGGTALGGRRLTALEHCMQTPRLSLFLCSQCACVR